MTMDKIQVITNLLRKFKNENASHPKKSSNKTKEDTQEHSLFATLSTHENTKPVQKRRC